MNAAIIVGAITAGLDLVERLMPLLDKLQLAGQISVEQQAAVRQRYNQLRATLDERFRAPHWQVGSEPPQP